jgi:hypothetical protein
MANDYYQDVYDAPPEPKVRGAYVSRRPNWYVITMVMWSALGLLEAMLGLRFLFKLLGANPNSGFAFFIYGLTWLFTLPFAGMLPNWVSDPRVFEFTTLIAMGVYWLFTWIVIRVLRKYAAAG